MHRIPAICLLAAMACHAPAQAEDSSGADDAAAFTATAEHLQSKYPSRWYLADDRPAASLTRPSVRAPVNSPNTLTARTSVQAVRDTAAPVVAEQPSLLERLRSVESRRLVTLWQGKKRAIVVGFQNGGFFGISLRDAPLAADPETSAR